MKFANPKQYLNLTSVCLKLTIPFSFVLLALGYAWVFLYVPADQVQGSVFKILYLHVPMAWFSMGLYTALLGASLSFLIWRHVVAVHVAWAAGITGLVATVVCLTTGMIWGKPTWGTWWVWDARLTSVFFLGLTYLIYNLLANISLYSTKISMASSVFAILGGINLPIIKWSVQWWHTLHQPASIMKLAAPSIHPTMLWPLLVCAIGWGFFCLNCVFLLSRARIRQHQNLIKGLTGKET